jgi:Domain of unknown function (DUF1918)
MPKPRSSSRPADGIRGDVRELADAEPGDWIEVDAMKGASPRHGVILEVLGAGGQRHFRVHWQGEQDREEQDRGHCEHESLYYPSPYGCLIHARAEAGG